MADECKIDCSPELLVYRLDELKRGQDHQREEMARLQEAVSSLREEVAGLKVKSGVWGAIAGTIPALVVALWYAIKGN